MIDTSMLDLDYADTSKPYHLANVRQREYHRIEWLNARIQEDLAAGREPYSPFVRERQGTYNYIQRLNWQMTFVHPRPAAFLGSSILPAGVLIR